MGRRKKFFIDEVVKLSAPIKVYCTIVGYRVKGAQSQYQVVRLDYATGPAWGRPIWVNAEELEHTVDRSWWNPIKRPKVRRVVRANENLGDSTQRGCRCQCCPHTAIPRSVVAEEARENHEG